MGQLLAVHHQGVAVHGSTVSLTIMASFKHSDIEYLFTYRKTRIAYENLAERMLSGQSQGVAANNTGIELTRAAEVIKFK